MISDKGGRKPQRIRKEKEEFVDSSERSGVEDSRLIDRKSFHWSSGRATLPHEKIKEKGQKKETRLEWTNAISPQSKDEKSPKTKGGKGDRCVSWGFKGGEKSPTPERDRQGELLGVGLRRRKSLQRAGNYLSLNSHPEEKKAKKIQPEEKAR